MSTPHHNFIVMKGEETTAARSGKKTISRLPLHVQPLPPSNIRTIELHDLDDGQIGFFDENRTYEAPYKPGDIINAKEPWWHRTSSGLQQAAFADGTIIQLNADDSTEEITSPTLNPASDNTWTAQPANSMPEWARRSFKLHVTSIRAERLHNITPAEAKAEGTPGMMKIHSLSGMIAAQFLEDTNYSNDPSTDDVRFVAPYAQAWESQYRDQPQLTWAANPWVWRIQYQAIQ